MSNGTQRSPEEDEFFGDRQQAYADAQARTAAAKAERDSKKAAYETVKTASDADPSNAAAKAATEAAKAVFEAAEEAVRQAEEAEAAAKAAVEEEALAPPPNPGGTRRWAYAVGALAALALLVGVIALASKDSDIEDSIFGAVPPTPPVASTSPAPSTPAATPPVVAPTSPVAATPASPTPPAVAPTPPATASAAYGTVWTHDNLPWVEIHDGAKVVLAGPVASSTPTGFKTTSGQEFSWSAAAAKIGNNQSPVEMGGRTYGFNTGI